MITGETVRTVIRIRSAWVFLILLACTRQSRDLAPTPESGYALGSPASAGIAGDYRLTGRLQGTRVSARIRVDSSGRVSYLGGSPVGRPHVCDTPSEGTDRLIVRCGTVDLRLAVANGRLSPVARIAFDLPKAPRVEYNPFTCTPIPPDQACALLQQTRTPQVRHVSGGVSVERVSE
ncbi:MAG: hypothetical protein IPJ78_00040 [Gemmatimonadetes bacterium]|nr:hypothetical protein [Gemmatimonadota bacterium]